MLAERIIELTAQSMTLSQIGALLGITRNAVAGKIYRLRRDGLLGPAKQQIRLTSNERIERKRERNRVTQQTRVRRKQPYKPIPYEGIASIGIPFMELEPHHCQFILDERRDGLAVYCGLPKYDHAWCAGHAQHVYWVRND